MIGGNFRLDEIQAAILRIKLRYLHLWTTQRVNCAEEYDILFEEYDLPNIVTPLDVWDGHVYNQYVIGILDNTRDKLKEYLLKNGIETQIYYPVPLHKQECFSGYNNHLYPIAERWSETSLALPIYPGLTSEKQKYIVKTIKEFYSGM